MVNPTDPTPRDWNAGIVDWFLKNTQIALIIFLAVVLGGLTALFSLRSEGFPSPQIHTAIITSTYLGASPEEVERSIVKPLEDAISGIKGITDVNSTAGSNVGIVNVSFDAGADFTSAISELRNKVQDAQLPKDADKATVTVPSFGGNISYYAITGSGDAASLRSVAEDLRLDLEGVSGVKDFAPVVPITDSVEIRWSQDKLTKAGITLLDIQQTLQGNNISLPAGQLSQGNNAATVVTYASITSVNELKALKIHSSQNPLSPPVQLSDLADVVPVASNPSLVTQIGYKDPTNATGLSALKSGLLYQLTYSDTASVLKVAPNVAKVIDAKRQLVQAEGKDVVVVSDVAQSIQNQVDEVVGGAIGNKIGDKPIGNLGYILGGIWLIMIAMLVFVSWRAAIIAAVAVPLSLMFTLLALWVQGISLNTLTLFSMILVLGLIVDPAIVVLEAIQRQLDMGMRGRAAVISAINSVGNGVFYAVITSIIVFVPFGVVSGVFGQIIKYIPITVIPALIASYFVPMLFLTFLAQRFLKPSKDAVDDEEIGNLWKVSQWFVRTNTKILNKRWLQVVIIVLAIIVPLGVSGALFATGKISPVQFSSPHDTEDITVNVEFPSSSSDQYKRSLVSQVETYLVTRKDVYAYFPYIQTDKNLQMYVRLVPRKIRDTDSPEIVDAINADLSKYTQKNAGVFYTAEVQKIGTPEAAFPVAVNIYGDNLDALKKAAIKTGDILREQPKVTRVEDGYTNVSNPQIAITLNRDALAKAGLPAVQVATALNGLLGTVSVTKFQEDIDGNNRTAEVILTNQDKPTSVEAINSTIVSATSLGPVYVKDIASVSETNGITVINRLNGSRFVTVSAKVADPLKDAAAPQAAVKAFWTSDMLKSYGLRTDALESKGSGDQFVKSFTDLFVALGIAILLLYVALVIFLKSFLQPFIILFAVPLTFVGVFPALTLVGGQFGFLEILGIITLSGIVVNVGIFVLDQANQKRAEGVPLKQAIAEASGIRFRPIFLTKITALAGLLPLILFSPFWRSLATVVVAGVLVSGFLSLFTTPILYVWLSELTDRIKRGFARIKRS